MRSSNYQQGKRLLIFITVLFILSSCKKDDTGIITSGVDVFYQQMTSLTLDVAYEPGAEPYDINSAGENIWGFAEMNVESLFVQRAVHLDAIVPNGLSRMTLIPDQNKNGFTLSDIQNLASRYRHSAGNNVSGDIFILFLNGYYEKNDTLQQAVMGLNITGTTIVAVFKPLITASHVTKAVREFVEQSVVIHETGHALGLVNNGLPLTSPHQDTDHGVHCNNPGCVMYWANERSANITSFVQNYMGSNKKVLFKSECVADVTDYQP